LGKALIEYEKAMLLDPYSEQAIERLTTVYEHGGADLALLRKLERLAQSGTASSRLMEIAGRLYAEKGRYADAARCLKRAVEMDPHRRSASTALAQVYAQMDDPSAARALLMNPELQPASEPATPLIAALRAEQSGDRALAIEKYEAAIQAGDPSGIASNNLAWLYASQREQLDEALRLARWALERNPGNARVLDTLGMVQLQKRQFSQAITSFQRSLRRAALEKNSGQEQQAIAAHLASALEQAGVSPAH
jgi:tetratricopeptide (TPR) repeat protein